MNPKNVIGIVAAILFASLWALPLSRATSFVRAARDYSNETSSLDASDDLHFATSLLLSYSLSVVASFGLAWLVSRRPHLAFVVPAGLGLFAAAEVLWLHPESPVHLLPTISAWRPALISITAVAIAAILEVMLPWTSKFDKV
jgi:hypothetical protein